MDPQPDSQIPPTLPNVEPSVSSQVPSQPVPPPKKSPKRLLSVVAVLVLLAAAGTGSYFLLKSPKPASPVASNSNTPSQRLSSSSAAASAKNTSNRTLAFGFVKYQPEKLNPISTDQTGIDKLQLITELPSETGLSPVAFLQIYHVPYDTSLLMYDFKTDTTYQVTAEHDELVHHFYNPVILSDHYVAYYELTYKDPVTLEGSVHVIDLLSGQNQELVKDTAGNLPDNLCCSVSPNGLYLAIPKQPDIMDFFSAGGTKVDQLKVSASFLPTMYSGSGDKKILGDDDYAKAQLAGSDGYPSPRWLDNSRLVLANSPPKKYTGATATTINNGLSILDVNSGKSTPVKGTENYSISWFDTVGNSVVFASGNANFQESGDINKDLAQLSTKLYKVDLDSASGPKQLSYDFGSGGAIGPYAVDKSNQILYVQTAGIVAINLKDDTSKSYSISIKDPLVGFLDSNNLLFATTDTLSDNPTLETYDLSNGKVNQIF